MTRVFFLLSLSFVVLGLAFWAYKENYRTQSEIREVRSLNRQIGNAHHRIRMLKAEWAYLNRPDRLRELADMNFDRLQLMPMTGERFSEIRNVAYPTMVNMDVSDTSLVSSDSAEGPSQ